MLGDFRFWPFAAVHITENIVLSMAAIHRKAVVRTLALRIAASGLELPLGYTGDEWQ